MHDRRQVLLAPDDGIGKAGPQDLDGAGIGREDPLHHLLLLQHNGLAVHAFFAVGGRGAFGPGRIALRMVAHHHNRHVRLAGQGRGLPSV